MYLLPVKQNLTTRQSLDYIFNSIKDPPTLDQYFGSGQLLPCQKFVLRLLEDAFDCLRGYSNSDNLGGVLLACKQGTIAAEAEIWIRSEQQTPFSFIWCCYSLGWEHPEIIKNHMLKFTNHTLIRLSKNVRFSIWKTEKQGIHKNNFRGALEMEGIKTNIINCPTRRAAIVALQREFTIRGGQKWLA